MRSCMRSCHAMPCHADERGDALHDAGLASSSAAAAPHSAGTCQSPSSLSVSVGGYGHAPALTSAAMTSPRQTITGGCGAGACACTMMRPLLARSPVPRRRCHAATLCVRVRVRDAQTDGRADVAASMQPKPMPCHATMEAADATCRSAPFRFTAHRPAQPYQPVTVLVRAGHDHGMGCMGCMHGAAQDRACASRAPAQGRRVP